MARYSYANRLLHRRASSRQVLRLVQQREGQVITYIAMVKMLQWAIENAYKRLDQAYAADGDIIGPQIAIACYKAKLEGLIKP